VQDAGDVANVLLRQGKIEMVVVEERSLGGWVRTPLVEQGVAVKTIRTSRWPM